MPTRRAFVDANVLIAAVGGTAAVAAEALQVLDDPDREFVTSDLLWLETVPKPVFNRYPEQEEALRAFFDSAVAHALTDHATTQQAKQLACRYGLGGADALHVQAAIGLGAAEFVTAERRTSPLSRVGEIAVTFIGPP